MQLEQLLALLACPVATNSVAPKNARLAPRTTSVRSVRLSNAAPCSSTRFKANVTANRAQMVKTARTLNRRPVRTMSA